MPSEWKWSTECGNGKIHFENSSYKHLESYLKTMLGKSVREQCLKIVLEHLVYYLGVHFGNNIRNLLDEHHFKNS